MKDVLFLIPLYYTDKSVERFAQYLRENRPKYSVDVFMCCSNPDIFPAAAQRCRRYGYFCELRDNCGGGEGALWYLQKKANLDLKNYRYMWYFEESCEPIRYDWLTLVVEAMEKGRPLAGWDWHSEGRKRPGAIRHLIKGENGNEMIAYENTEKSGNDGEGNSLNKIWDTAGYRDENIIVRMADFVEFDYPDASDRFWQERNGVRGYGVRAERMWWDMKDKPTHGFKFHSPNIQWHILNKYGYVASKANEYYDLFRELEMRERRKNDYRPIALPVRTLWHRLKRSWLT
jgi:hypothetical protein